MVLRTVEQSRECMHWCGSITTATQIHEQRGWSAVFIAVKLTERDTILPHTLHHITHLPP